MAIAYFEVWRANSPGGPFSLIGTTTNTSFIDETAVVGNEYCYYFTVVDNLNIRSEPSEIYCYELVEDNQKLAINIEDALGASNFKYISDVLAESVELAKDALAHLLCMRRELTDCNINEGNRFRIQLNSHIEATYVAIVNKNLFYAHPVTSAVRALNQHVLSSYNNDNMDEFLSQQFLEAVPTYASLSNFIGYPITEIGSSAARYQDLTTVWNEIDTLNWDRIGWSNV